jgi:hypothetical protein
MRTGCPSAAAEEPSISGVLHLSPSGPLQVTFASIRHLNRSIAALAIKTPRCISCCKHALQAKALHCSPARSPLSGVGIGLIVVNASGYDGLSAKLEAA